MSVLLKLLANRSNDWPIGGKLATILAQHSETAQETFDRDLGGGNLNALRARDDALEGRTIHGRYMMRLTALATLVGAAFTAMTAPAMAAWHGYISHPLGFGFAAPGKIKVEKGTYRAPVAGQRNSLIYSFTDDGIEYKAVVIDTRDIANNAATLLGEAEYLFQQNKKVLNDRPERFDRQFGRKVTVDLPNNGGRTTAAFYFIRGRIISLQATVPANGDYDTPDMGRFVDSLTFLTVRAADDAIELLVPPT
jgi:hypothetical protein